MSEKRKPCPHCGGKSEFAHISASPMRPRFYAYCPDCNSCGPVDFDAQKAAALWNTRTPDPRIEKLAEALRPFADLFDRPWDDKAEAVAIAERGGSVSELQAVDLFDVLRARAALSELEGRK